MSIKGLFLIIILSFLSVFSWAENSSSIFYCKNNELVEVTLEKGDNKAEPRDVTIGKTYWDLTEENWGIQKGERGVTCQFGDNRFKDNKNGTITDKCTNLTWLKNANCFTKISLEEAKKDINVLNENKKECGLSSDNLGIRWYLPTIKELATLIDYSSSSINDALPKINPFDNVQPLQYWSSTISTKEKNKQWTINFSNGAIVVMPSDISQATAFVLPVSRIE